MRTMGLLAGGLIFGWSWLIAHVRWHTDGHYRDKYTAEATREERR